MCAPILFSQIPGFARRCWQTSVGSMLKSLCNPCGSHHSGQGSSFPNLPVTAWVTLAMLAETNITDSVQIASQIMSHSWDLPLTDLPSRRAVTKGNRGNKAVQQLAGFDLCHMTSWNKHRACVSTVFRRPCHGAHLLQRGSWA